MSSTVRRLNAAKGKDCCITANGQRGPPTDVVSAFQSRRPRGRAVCSEEAHPCRGHNVRPHCAVENEPRKKFGPGMGVRISTKGGTVALALMVLALIWGFTPISRFANPEAVAAAMAVISVSPWQLPIVLGCFLGAGLVVFPMLLLIIACAAVFGPLLGFVYSSAGLMASAALNY